MVRRLKYGGVTAVAEHLATGLSGVLPDDATGLVPVPRAAWRGIRYGIDPGLELARRLARITGLPLIRGLLPPLVSRRHAGRDRRHRIPVRFRAMGEVPEAAVLVDDVVTTGVTLLSARLALPMITRGVTVTAAPRVTSLRAERRPGSAEFDR